MASLKALIERGRFWCSDSPACLAQLTALRGVSVEAL
jgi:hypothetical protein